VARSTGGSVELTLKRRVPDYRRGAPSESGETFGHELDAVSCRSIEQSPGAGVFVPEGRARIAQRFIAGGAQFNVGESRRDG
jgi:hypothetical protein